MQRLFLFLSDRWTKKKVLSQSLVQGGLILLAYILLSCALSHQKPVDSIEIVDETAKTTKDLAPLSESEPEKTGTESSREPVIKDNRESEKTGDVTSKKSTLPKEQPSDKIQPLPHKKEEKPASVKAITPFSRHQDRYQVLYDSLVKGGMKPERIEAIFSSQRAKKVDKTPVKRMSKKVVRKISKRSKKTTLHIARKIKRHLGQYKKYYDYIEHNYGVNREIAAAILFKETSLGQFRNWKHESFTVLNSILSFMKLPDESDSRNRARIERTLATTQESLAGLLLYCHKYNIDILHKRFPSSFAGAIGIPQFLPMYMDYVISIDNSVPNLSHMPDAIVSLGNLLKSKFKWPGYMDFDKLTDIDEIRKKYTRYDKNQKDVTFSAPVNLEGYPLRRFVDEYSEIHHVEYIGIYVQVLMNYNFSSHYALDVLHYAYYTHSL